MQANHQTPEQLFNLIEAFCLDEITTDQANLLEELVRHDHDARTVFVKFLHMHALAEQFEAANVLGIVDSVVDKTKTEETRVEADSRALGDSLLRAQAAAQVSPRPLGVLVGTRGVGRNASMFATFGVATLVYGAFGFLVWQMSHFKPTPNYQQEAFLEGATNQPVATILNATDVRWPRDILRKADNSPLHKGETLKIESGTIELELQAGAKLIVEGPADWTVDSHNRVSLRAGRLLASVPKQAIGFTIETPTAVVVDLGTEFGVEVNESGTTEVQVFKGKIEVHPGQKITNLSQANDAITLSAGEARRIEFVGDNADPVVRKIAASPDRLIRKSEGAGSRRIPVFGAQASSTHSSDLDVNNLIDGSGLMGERHSAIVKNTMWYAAPGKIEGEYVLFDLGRLHQLESMKVWNYNDEYTGEYRWRGVKQADIYVSNTNKGLPRDASGDWRLVAADVQFEPGTGTADYSTPTVIPLGGVKARFVAIVIDKALGHDPRGAAAEPDGVGLSEVRFFGERVTTATSPKQKN